MPATAKVLAATSLTLADIDLIELNEAFAAQVLACTREWKLVDADFERVNVNGSGISLGHPVGATGGRILATLAREMLRRDDGSCAGKDLGGGDQDPVQHLVLVAGPPHEVDGDRRHRVLHLDDAHAVER